MNTRNAKTVEELVRSLEAAAEELNRLVCEEAAPERVAAAWSRRVDRFEALREAGPDPSALSKSARSSLARIADLDRNTIHEAHENVEILKGQRVALTRAKSALTAHSKREREQPRLLEVTA